VILELIVSDQTWLMFQGNYAIIDRNAEMRPGFSYSFDPKGILKIDGLCLQPCSDACKYADEAVDQKCLPCGQEVACVDGLLPVRSEQESQRFRNRFR